MDYKEKVIALLNSQELSEEQKAKLEEAFPELHESEDEKVRKWLIRTLKALNTAGVDIDGAYEMMLSSIAWLEKQGEMKPLPSDYDKAFDEFLSHIPEKDPESSNSLYTYEDLESAIQFGIRWQKEQKPAWSEEDEYHKRQILRIFKDNGCSQILQDKTEKWIEKKFKSLRPQSHWKPSLAQLNALGVVAKGNAPDDIEEISSLYKELKKLKG